MHFTPDETEYLRNMVAGWIDEGFERPPYDKEVYSIIQKLGITQGGDIGQYDITPPPEMREYLSRQEDPDITLPRAGEHPHG